MKARLPLLALAAVFLTAGCGTETTPLVSTEAPMLPPMNVTVTQLPCGYAVVSWDANPQALLKGYNVYRFDPERSTIHLLAPSVTKTNFTDQSVVYNHTYDYRVTSVSFRGDESGYASSGEVILAAPEHGKTDRRLDG
jgi:fibronectin type 3 domain-containing protein